MGFNVINAATNAVNTVKTTLTTSGPASGLSSLASGLASGLSGSLGSIAGSVAGLLGFGGKNIVSVNTPLPLPNILNNYATYNYVISLGVLSDNEVNFPDSTYKAGIEPKLILKSGNGSPDNRIATAYGKFDFYIENLVLNQTIGMDKASGNTNVNTFDFQVIEPYSMGMFMISCQQAAFDAGYKNFREAAFVLIIEFRGNTQQGVPQNISVAKKYIPFRFTNISMKVNAKGSLYNVSGLPYNEQAFSKQVSALKSDATVSGKTVQEILQTGENSLQAVVNQRYRQLAQDNIVKVPDQVVILFPIDLASDASSTGTSDEQENNSSATENSSSSAANSSLFQKLGVSISSVNKTLVQGDGQCNAIGKSKMGFGLTRKASTPMTKGSQVYNSRTGVEVRGKMTIDPEISDFKFSQDSNIPNAINQVILASTFPEASLDPANLTPEGYRGWWRIETQVYNISTDENLNSTGTKPKLYVYRVVPYAVHASRLMPPGAPAPGFQKLVQQVVKEYNYIYTGKNQDIINFNIEIANGFQQMMLADNGNRSADEKTSKKDAAGIDKSAEIENKKGDTPAGTPGGGMVAQMSYSATRSSFDGKGGGGAETNSTRVAKLFHDALTNGKDLVNLDLEIMGDPYFLATSGMGNYTSKETNYANLTADGEVNYQNGEVDIVINFRTPIDINQMTGLYDFGGAVAVNQFSGLYKVTNVTSTFNKGKFTQKLTGFRRQGQDDFRNANPSKVPTATPTKQEPETEYASPTGVELRTDEEIKASEDLGDFPG